MKEFVKGAIELCEEGTMLWRRAGAPAWAWYYAGSMPFFAAFLYFWSDMAHGSLADTRLIPQSLGLTILFLWMKGCHGVAAYVLRARFTGESSRMTLREIVRMMLAQARLQPWGIALIPVAAVIAAPLGWVYAYFQSVTALAHPDAEKQLNLHDEAMRQTALWPKQNHLGLATLAGLWWFMFFNMAIALIFIPRLIIMLLGLRSVFEPNIWLMTNTTYIALVFSITHLTIDPVIKAFYVLRCFYGQSRRTGEDLRVVLKRARVPQAAAIAVFAIGMLFAGPATQAAAAPSAPRQAQSISPSELNSTIDETLGEAEYNWRFPRRSADDGEPTTLIGRFLRSIRNWVSDASRGVGRWIRDVLKWLFDTLTPKDSGPGAFSFSTPKGLILLLVGIAVAILAALILRGWLRQRKRAGVQPIAASPVIIDLESENVRADDLPQDEWLRLASDLASKGDLRLAIRALFLSGLAFLADRRLVSLANFKSNREYERELRRRAAASPRVPGTFSAMVGAYDRVWYGAHPATPELFQEFQHQVQELKGA